MMQTHANERFNVSRAKTIRFWRPIAVWTCVTAAAGVAAVAVPGSWAAAHAGRGPAGVADLLVAACATGLALALAWLWVVTTVTVAGLLAATPRPGSARTGGATRRLILLACGAAVVAGTSVPAQASGGDGRDLLAGLTLPERAVAPAQRHRAPEPPASATAASPQIYVVRAGDSLWSISRDHPDGSASVDHRWRAIWHANRDVLGSDPDLIIPGQVLRLPTTHTTQDPSSDGDR